MRLNVGKIINTHGLKGELKILSRTNFEEERFKEGSKLLITQGNKVVKEVEVEFARFHKGKYLIKFVGINDINEAEIYKNMQIKVSDEYLCDLDEGEFYFYEIIGCEVFDENKNLLGEVIDILQTGANDVWVVKSLNNKEYLIPYIDDIIKEINIEEKKIFIAKMEGLFD